MIDGDNVFPAIRAIVSADDFESEACRAIFCAAQSLSSDDESIDPVSIGKRAKRAGDDLPDVFLVELMEIVPTTANCVEYAHRVSEEAKIRRIKCLAEQIQQDTVSTADELTATMQREMEAIRGKGFQRCLLPPSETLRRFTDHVVEAGDGSCTFVESGFHGLDSVLGGGFLCGGLYILAARPAVGKSTFAVNLADNIAAAGNALFVSLEMTTEQVTAKRVSRLTGLSSSALLSGHVSDADWVSIASATAALYERGVYMNARYDMTVQQIQLLAQSVPDLRAVIVDYLGLIQPATRGGTAYERVSEVSRDLKRMAISMNVPVVCLCQLSRSVESREDKHPRLSDLRDSGAIEQDADSVMFLYRDDYYGTSETGKQEGSAPSLVELTVAKNRHGATGRAFFNFWKTCSTFKEVT